VDEQVGRARGVDGCEDVDGYEDGYEDADGYIHEDGHAHAHAQEEEGASALASGRGYRHLGPLEGAVSQMTRTGALGRQALVLLRVRVRVLLLVYVLVYVLVLVHDPTRKASPLRSWPSLYRAISKPPKNYLRRLLRASPMSLGVCATFTPAASSAAIFSAAVPLPPLMMAPA
jgi:hypothetical protein